jgi:hypothetical protein
MLINFVHNPPTSVKLSADPEEPPSNAFPWSGSTFRMPSQIWIFILASNFEPVDKWMDALSICLGSD